MRKLLLAAGALALAVGSGAAMADQGRGQGQGRGGGHEARGQGQGKGQGQQQARGRGQDNRGVRGGPISVVERPHSPPGQARVERRGREDRPAEARGQGRGRGSEQVAIPSRGDERRAENRGRGNGEARGRLTQRRPVRIADPNAVERIRFEPQRRRGLVNGCPPGLAKRNNGCLPPGQERQLQRSWVEPLFALGRSGIPVVYDNGYLYQLQPDGGLLGYQPLLGGALWPGQTWPSAFEAAAVPNYYVDYFGLQDPYDYRFADGVLYGLDPETQAIQSIAALLTGDDWTIGQPMPAGYDVYNVPFDYRDQYVDSADAMYRYSDGYVYQVDPTTQIVQSIIQLIS